MLARYGAPRGESGLTWQGMLIGAPAGEAVHSVHRGRVAYADWLRGFGLLLIVEHGNGFMSLYGHNAEPDPGYWRLGGIGRDHRHRRATAAGVHRAVPVL